MSQLRRSGRHLILDGFSPPEVLRDREHLEMVLLRLAEAAQMKVLDLQIYEVPEDDSVLTKESFEDPGGLTGFAVLTTSHVSFHTFPATGELRFDLYSCKDFDADLVEKMLLEELRVEGAEKVNWVR